MALFSKEPPTSQPAPSRREASSAPGGATLIGPNAVIEGTVSGSDSVVIEGTVRGEVNLSGDLQIGTKARVDATVHARNIVVEGRVCGDISADTRVELVASASVEGNIKAPRIVVAEGATFRGSVDMGAPRPAEQPEPATTAK